MNFDIRDPNTWFDLGQHPFYTKGIYSKDWFEGDIDKNLFLLKDACLSILKAFPNYHCVIYVDNGSTVYVELYKEKKLIAELYPTQFSAGQRYLYFYLFNHLKGEVIVFTAEEAKEVVCAIEKGDDLAEYPDTDDF